MKPKRLKSKFDRECARRTRDMCWEFMHKVRNEQCRIRHGRLFYFADNSMYVYYVPTHWKPIPVEGGAL